jgi:hypothetical protein
MKKQILIGSAVVSAAVALAFAAQDKYSLTVPDGLAFADFRGYEDWQTIAVSQTDSQDVIRVILGNPVTIKAFRQGIPENGEPLPDGAKIAKILWNRKTITDAPFSASNPDTVSGTLRAVELMEKDTKRFPDQHGWGFGEFTYENASGTFKPLGTGAACGATCHSPAAKTDYVFTKYALR